MEICSSTLGIFSPSDFLMCLWNCQRERSQREIFECSPDKKQENKLSTQKHGFFAPSNVWPNHFILESKCLFQANQITWKYKSSSCSWWLYRGIKTQPVWTFLKLLISWPVGRSQLTLLLHKADYKWPILTFNRHRGEPGFIWGSTSGYLTCSSKTHDLFYSVSELFFMERDWTKKFAHKNQTMTLTRLKCVGVKGNCVRWSIFNIKVLMQVQI